MEMLDEGTFASESELYPHRVLPQNIEAGRVELERLEADFTTSQTSDL